MSIYKRNIIREGFRTVGSSPSPSPSVDTDLSVYYSGILPLLSMEFGRASYDECLQVARDNPDVPDVFRTEFAEILASRTNRGGGLSIYDASDMFSREARWERRRLSQRSLGSPSMSSSASFSASPSASPSVSASEDEWDD
jgi:hypothetical protein